MARVLPTRRIRAAHHRTAVGVVMILVCVLAPALAASPAAAQGCMIDGTTYQILGGGDKIWIGTSVFSNWKPGPASISRSESKSGTTTSSHGSSDTVSGGVNWGVVSAQYNHEWNRSTAQSTSLEKTWTYETQIPAGMTARARVFKRGWSFPARKHVSYRRSSTCPKSGDSWDFRARIPLASNSNNFYCDARDKWPGSDIIPHAKCTNV
jgi:hypothetical protein